jgi:hypothetical protein
MGTAAAAGVQVREAYIAELEALPLPVDESALDAVHQSAMAAALDRFDRASFGASGSAELQACWPRTSVYVTF